MEPLIAYALIVWTNTVEIKATPLQFPSIVAYYPIDETSNGQEECEKALVNYIKTMPGHTASCLLTASRPKPVKVK